MMKITRLAIAAMVAAFGFGTQVQAQAPVKIVYADYMGPKHPTNVVLVEFFKNVERDTNNSVKFEWHFAQSLLVGKDIPAGVRDGVADSGYIVGVYVPSEMPVDNYISDFGLLNTDPIAMTGVVNELVILNCPDCTAEYEGRLKTKYLSTIALTPYVYHCKPHIKSLADMKGKKLRSVGAWVDLARAMDAIPVNVNATEAHQAVDRGTIDCAMHTITAQRSYSYGDVAKNVILNPVGGYLGGSMFNLRLEKWKSLTKAQRDAIVKNQPELVASAVFNYLRLDDEVMSLYKDKGTNFYNADSDLGNFIAEFPTKYMPTAIEKGKKRGVKHAEQIAKEFQRLRAKWKALLEANGRDKATFQRLLWQEIYSKIPTS